MHLDLRHDTVPRRLRNLLLVALTLAAGWQVQRALSLREEWHALAAASAMHSPENTVTVPVTDEQQAALARIRNELRTPWEPMLDAVLDNAGTEVRLVSIRPDVPGARVEIAGTAASRRAYLDYAERLRRDARTGETLPLGDELDGGPGSPGVTFRLQVAWRTGP